MKREITLRQVLIPAFLTVVVLPMLLMALFSILRLKANMQETLEMQSGEGRPGAGYGTG